MLPELRSGILQILLMNICKISYPLWVVATDLLSLKLDYTFSDDCFDAVGEVFFFFFCKLFRFDGRVNDDADLGTLHAAFFFKTFP